MNKKYICALGALLLTIVSINAQISNTTKETNTEIISINDKETYKIKTIDEKVQRLVFKSEDKGEVNQSVAPLPTAVTKTIFIDNDKNDGFDKKIRLLYSKNQDDQLVYTTTQEGIIFLNDTGSTDVITKEGLYQIDTETIDNVIIMVENLPSK